jgi:hypothetical protein
MFKTQALERYDIDPEVQRIENVRTSADADASQRAEYKEQNAQSRDHRAEHSRAENKARLQT